MKPMGPIDAVERAELEHLRLATRLSGLYMWSFELVGGVLANANARFTRLWESIGYEHDDVPAELGSSVALVLLPDDQARVLAEMQAFLDGDADQFESEFRIPDKDGSIHWNLARGVAIRDGGGRPIRFSGRSVDVTHLKLLEEDAHVARELLDSATRLSGYSVVELDLRGVAQAGQALVKGAGGWEERGLRSLAPLSFYDFLELTTALQDLPAMLDNFHAIIRGEPRDLVEFRARNPVDGGIRWRWGAASASTMPAASRCDTSRSRTTSSRSRLRRPRRGARSNSCGWRQATPASPPGVSISRPVPDVDRSGSAGKRMPDATGTISVLAGFDRNHGPGRSGPDSRHYLADGPSISR
jgi:PAS domain S-box-containing protein